MGWELVALAVVVAWLGFLLDRIRTLQGRAFWIALAAFVTGVLLGYAWGAY